MVALPPGGVTVLLGSEPERRRVLASLADTIPSARGVSGPRVRRVVASPALPVAKRVAFLRAAAHARADLVVVARATAGLDARERRLFLDHLHLATCGGTAVVVDDDDPVAALAVADHALRCSGRPELVDVDAVVAALVTRS